MNIKIIFCATLMTAAFAACSQMEENEAGKQGEEAVGATLNSDVEVRLSSGGLSTRASIESRPDSFELNNIGIYMLATNRIDNSVTEVIPNWYDAQCAKMNNVETNAVRNTLTGVTDLVWTDPTAIYWYPYESRYAFSFYGYYPRVEDSDITFGSARVEANYTGLDGTKDIIWGQTMRADVNDAQEKYRYSALYFHQAGHADACPNVSFEHKLMRIQFYIQGVEDKNPAIGFDRANKMQLESVQIYARNNDTESGVWNGVPTTASLVIADLNNPGYEGKLNVNWNGSLAPVTMLDENDTPYENKKRIHNGDLIKVGQPLLLPVPDADAGAGFRYGAQIKLKMFDNEGNVETEINDASPIDLNLGGTTASVRPGHTYRVIIKISGPQRVTLNATLTPWEEIDEEGINVQL